MSNIDVSVVNSKKLDDLDEKIERLEKKIDHTTQLLSGDGQDAPGLMARVAGIERALYGQEANREGVIYKVNILWRVHVWVLCTLSALAGSALTMLVPKIIKLLGF